MERDWDPVESEEDTILRETVLNVIKVTTPRHQLSTGYSLVLFVWNVQPKKMKSGLEM